MPDLTAAPFHLPPPYESARRLIESGVRTFRTTSVGRLFDAVAALLGFTRPVTFEGQAAIWLEHLARPSTTRQALRFPWAGGELDYREAIAAVIAARRRGDDVADIARAFHRGLAEAVAALASSLARDHDAEAVVLSGGVFQNVLVLRDLAALFARERVAVWTNHEVPANPSCRLGSSYRLSIGLITIVMPHPSAMTRTTVVLAVTATLVAAVPIVQAPFVIRRFDDRLLGLGPVTRAAGLAGGGVPMRRAPIVLWDLFAGVRTEETRILRGCRLPLPAACRSPSTSIVRPLRAVMRRSCRSKAGRGSGARRATMRSPRGCAPPAGRRCSSKSPGPDIGSTPCQTDPAASCRCTTSNASCRGRSSPLEIEAS